MLKKVVSHDHINVDMLMHLSCSVGKVHVSRDKGLAPINVQWGVGTLNPIKLKQLTSAISPLCLETDPSSIDSSNESYSWSTLCLQLLDENLQQRKCTQNTDPQTSWHSGMFVWSHYVCENTAIQQQGINIGIQTTVFLESCQEPNQGFEFKKHSLMESKEHLGHIQLMHSCFIENMQHQGL